MSFISSIYHVFISFHNNDLVFNILHLVYFVLSSEMPHRVLHFYFTFYREKSKCIVKSLTPEAICEF